MQGRVTSLGLPGPSLVTADGSERHTGAVLLESSLAPTYAL